MNTPRLVWISALAVLGCKGKAGGGGGGQPPVARDAGAAMVADGGGGSGAGTGSGSGLIDPPEAPDEATLRQGKRTGLGAPDEKPEVATEELIEAIVNGTVAWTRFIDPARGVVELKLPAQGAAVARRCGAAQTAALDELTKAMTAAGSGGLGYALDCDNAGLAARDPGGAMAAAICSLESEAAGTTIFDLVFVPDAALGLRLVGVSTVPAETDPGAALGELEAEMGAAGGRCP